MAKINNTKYVRTRYGHVNVKTNEINTKIFKNGIFYNSSVKIKNGTFLELYTSDHKKFYHVNIDGALYYINYKCLRMVTIKKKNHANDNNKDVESNVKSKKSRKSSKNPPVNYKIRNDGIYSLAEDERGFSNNKWGGHKPSSITKVKGTFGAASDVRSVSPAVWAQVQKRYP